MMAPSKKLEIIYHDGQPDGIRSIRRHLSTITTYVIPRTMLSNAKSISGINRPGIYYLINEDEDNNIAQIYVGQTRNGISILGFIFYKFLSDKEVKYLKQNDWADEDIKEYLNEDDRETVESIQKNVGYFITCLNLSSEFSI